MSRPNSTRLLLFALITGAAVWLVSEVLELVISGRSPVTLWLTASFHGLMAIGIWGAYAGQSGRRSLLSLIAAAAASIGYLLLIYPPLAASRSADTTIVEVMASSPLLQLAGLLAVLGTILFGIAVLLRRTYPEWTGVALAVCPVIFTALLMSDGPYVIGLAANMIESVALVAIGLQAMRSTAVPN